MAAVAMEHGGSRQRESARNALLPLLRPQLLPLLWPLLPSTDYSHARKQTARCDSASLPLSVTLCGAGVRLRRWQRSRHSWRAVSLARRRPRQAAAAAVWTRRRLSFASRAMRRWRRPRGCARAWRS
eukprot:260579-Chlamydomonas_euryale.AAC.1